MKSFHSFFSQTIALLLTLSFISSGNSVPQSCACSLTKKLSISSSTSPISSSDQNDDQSSDSSNPSEEAHDDVVLIDQKNAEPFAYSIFIPIEPLPLVSHPTSPLQRPPRV